MTGQGVKVRRQGSGFDVYIIQPSIGAASAITSIALQRAWDAPLHLFPGLRPLSTPNNECLRRAWGPLHEDRRKTNPKILIKGRG